MSNHHMHPTVAERLRLVELYCGMGYTLSEAIEMAWAAKLRSNGRYY
jgi:hypothetical protein